MRNESISLVFPAHNEEANIASSIREANTALSVITSKYEIIVVNDGSKDRTSAIVREEMRTNPHLKLIEHAKNQGYGGALWSGFQNAACDLIFFTDSDLQFKIDEIPKLLEYYPEYQVVIGYRAPRKDPFMRILNGKGWSMLNNLLFGLNVRDIDCAFKLFPRELLTGLPLLTRGATMSAEILIRLKKKGVVWKQVPVTHMPRKAGSPTGAKPSVIIRAFRELFMLYFALRREDALNKK